MPGTLVTLTQGGTACSLALRAGGFLGHRKSLSRASSGLAGHPFVLCPEDREGSASGPGLRGAGATESAVGRQDRHTQGGQVLSGPPPPLQAPGVWGKVVLLLPMTLGDRAREVGASGASCSGVGNATQPRLHAGLDRELPP